MDKSRERTQLNRVFGARSKEASDHERPDFLFEVDGCPKLGVEVTSVYASNADAKLKLIPGYTESLIGKTQLVHRSDKEFLRVADATFLNPDGSPGEKITGIFQEMPSKKNAYELLFSNIDEKGAKIGEYLKSCDEVDLIIEDGSGLFRHETYEDFYKVFHSLVPRSEIIKTGFREIHLITNTSGLQRVYIPLVANIFFADCFAYEHLLRPSIDAGRSSGEIFQILLACLWHDGYGGRVKTTAGPEGVGVFCGAWEMFYADDGKKLRDWNFPAPVYKGELLATFVSNMANEFIEEARALKNDRTTWFSALDVRLPAHEV